MSEPPPRLRLRFADGEQDLRFDEAVILKDRLKTTHTLAALTLGQRLEEHLRSGALEEPFELDADEILTVRFVLADAELDNEPGLETLRVTLREVSERRAD
jgi:hypothetical protein